MNLWLKLCSQPDLVRVGSSLVHSVWEVTACAAALAAGMGVVRGARGRYLLACAALALAVALPVGTWFFLKDAAPAYSAAPLSIGAAADHILTVASGAASSTASSTSAAAASHPAATSQSAFWQASTLTATLGAVWVTAVAVMAALQIAAHFRIAGIKRLGLDAIAPAALLRLSQKLGVRPGVRALLSDCFDGPVVVGFFKPVILIPASVVAGISPAELEAILLHELAHVRRGDYLVNALAVLAETLLFYHPGAWWIASVIRREREYCCDDLAASACGKPTVYASALTRLEELRIGAGPRLTLAATGGDAALATRVKRVLGLATQTTHRAGRSVLATTVVLGIVLAGLACVMMAGPDRKAASAHAATEPATAAPFAPETAEAHRQVDEARRQADTARREADQARQEADQVRRDVDQRRRVLEQAYRDLQSAQQELARQDRDLAAEKAKAAAGALEARRSNSAAATRAGVAPDDAAIKVLTDKFTFATHDMAAKRAEIYAKIASVKANLAAGEWTKNKLAAEGNFAEGKLAEGKLAEGKLNDRNEWTWTWKDAMTLEAPTSVPPLNSAGTRTLHGLLVRSGSSNTPPSTPPSNPPSNTPESARTPAMYYLSGTKSPGAYPLGDTPPTLADALKSAGVDASQTDGAVLLKHPDGSRETYPLKDVLSTKLPAVRITPGTVIMLDPARVLDKRPTYVIRGDLPRAGEYSLDARVNVLQAIITAGGDPATLRDCFITLRTHPSPRAEELKTLRMSELIEGRPPEVEPKEEITILPPSADPAHETIADAPHTSGFFGKPWQPTREKTPTPFDATSPVTPPASRP